jgi:hypothetical protein
MVSMPGEDLVVAAWWLESLTAPNETVLRSLSAMR